jgi:hypothetical protein
VLFLRRSSLVARPLTALERRTVLDALSRCRVAGPALCRRAVELALLLPREPTLAEVRGPRSLVAHLALAARADGIALGRRIFLRHELFGPDGSVPIDLVAHEVAHVAQYLRDGTLPFCLRYAGAYAAARARGLDDHRAYLAIPYEVEARAVAASADPSVGDVHVLQRRSV